MPLISSQPRVWSIGDPSWSNLGTPTCPSYTVMLDWPSDPLSLSLLSSATHGAMSSTPADGAVLAQGLERPAVSCTGRQHPIRGLSCRAGLALRTCPVGAAGRLVLVELGG